MFEIKASTFRRKDDKILTALSEPTEKNSHWQVITLLTSLVAQVSFGERPSSMRISTLFGGEFNGAVRATELSVTTNMAASSILQDSIVVSSSEK